MIADVVYTFETLAKILYRNVNKIVDYWAQSSTDKINDISIRVNYDYYLNNVCTLL